MPLILPLMRGGGLHYRVMLCGRGLRTTHIHRPLTTCFLGAKIGIFLLSSKYFLSFLQFFLLQRPYLQIKFVLLRQVSPNRRKRRKLRLGSLSAGWWYDIEGKTLALAIIQNVQKLAGGKNNTVIMVALTGISGRFPVFCI